MQEFPYVLSEYEEINSLLYKPINSTHRIKYTCLNASSNYIVLGSTSGSLYLFSRKPCCFLQLIPLSEGAVSRVLISPDERTIALATTRGSVCLVGLKPTPKLVAVSTEHIHEQINCLCWNDNSSEIYVGDGSGKVSVTVLSIFTVNGMFQAPACTLMNLDSSIVQLSFSSPLLLVSTLTRCYICDTVQEQYKQIGNKTRNGEFGACFFKTHHARDKSVSISQKEEKLMNKKRSFNFIREDDGSVQDENFSKMFCARPGSRLWEVSANGIVMKTHQFKEALAVPPVIICKPNVGKSVRKKQTDHTWLPQSINFTHLFIIADKYLFSYTPCGLYVIDPASATILLWNNEFTNIAMAETVEDKIYLMTYDGEFRCLTFSTLDNLILRLYSAKQYNECLEICCLYKLQLEQSISVTEMSKICDIESKLQTLRDDELSTLLHPIIFLLQSNSDTTPKKLESGIVVVNSGNSNVKDQNGIRNESQIHRSSRLHLETEETKDIENDSLDSTILNSALNSEVSDLNCNVGPLSEVELQDESLAELEADRNTNTDITQRIQTDLEAIYALANSIRSSISESELENIMLDAEEKLSTIKNTYETLTELKSFVYEVMRSAELYYFNTLLESITVQLVNAINNSYIMKKLIKAFVNINEQNCARCTCGYPRPTNQPTEPKFLGIGKSLVRNCIEKNEEEECFNLCNKVPYMWREYLPIYVEHQGVSNDLLRQCLQITDSVVLAFLLPLIDAKQWSIAVKCLRKMKEGRCIFCEEFLKEEKESVVDWTAITREVMKKQGPDVAMKFLKKVEETIPNVPIDKSIFQSMIFTKILHQHGLKRTVDFSKSTFVSSEYNTICSPKVRDQLIKSLEKDLRRPINKNVFASGAHHWGMLYKNKSPTCPCCTLSLQTPVLLGNNGIAIFSCGHAYHVNCMIEKKLTTCNLH